MAKKHDLSERIKIDQNALNDELVEQPALFMAASNAYVMAISERDEAKADVDVARAEAYFDIRRSSKEKVTEATISAQIELDKNYRVACKNYLEAKQAASEAETLKESFAQKGYVLKELAALYIAGYFGTSSVSGPESREVQRRGYEEKRSEIAKQRRARL